MVRFFLPLGLFACSGGGDGAEDTAPADATQDIAVAFDAVVAGEAAMCGMSYTLGAQTTELTAPYMHDGSMETLEEVLDHYARGGRLIEEGPHAGAGAESPLKSGLVAGFALSDTERSDLIAFLGALTDEAFLTDPALSEPSP